MRSYHYGIQASIEADERHERMVALLWKLLVAPVVLVCFAMTVETGSVKYLGKSPFSAGKRAVAKIMKKDSPKTSSQPNLAGEI